MKIVSIIPARGGSKRLPRKNLLPLAGKPLLAHSIEHARASSLVTRVIVSTDDAEIASTARQHGAEVIHRPSELSSDWATSESVLRHSVETLKDREGFEAGLIVFLQCTSPVRRTDDIDKAITALQDQQADSLLSGCRSHAFIWRRTGSDLVSVNYDYHHRQRSQDFHEEFVENGSIYIFKPWVLDKYDNRLGGKIAIFEMDYWSSFQIDSQEELELCEWILSRRQVVPTEVS